MANKIREEFIKDPYYVIKGILEYYDNGDIVAKDFYRVILGKYVAKEDVTRDFYGRMVSRGNTTASLIDSAYNSNKQK